MRRLYRLCLTATLLCALLAPPCQAQLTVLLDIVGGSPALQDNVRAHLSSDDLPCDITEKRLLRSLRRADDEISRALRALGYYHGRWQIDHRADSRFEEGLGKKLTNQRQDCWRLSMQLHPGEPVLIEQISVVVEGEAKLDPEFQHYLQHLPLRRGDQLDHGQYDSVKRSLTQRARNRGYLDAQLLQHTLQVDSERNRARIEIVFDSGSRYRFGEVSFASSPLDDALLRRFMPFASGDVFSNGKLIEFQSRLVSSAYFDSVSVEQQLADRDSLSIPVNVLTSAKKTYQTTLGLGASTDTGPRLSYGLHNRRVNPAGDTYNISSQLSPVQSNLGFTYSQPRADPLTEKLQWSTGVATEDTDSTESTSFQAKVALIDEIGHDWLQTSSLRFLREDYKIADQDSSSVLLIPEIAWAHTRSNDPAYPTRGWRLNAALRGTVREVISDINMAQLELDGKLILPLLGGRVISRTGIGVTALDEFDELPASLRFFAGGDNSVRGYGYKELGPEDSDGEVVGGKHRLTASMEYDHKVWRDVALATFYDAGNAFDLRDFTLYHSAGFGVRWFSPIGPIRVDLAFPLNEGGFRVHLSMGPDL